MITVPPSAVVIVLTPFTTTALLVALLATYDTCSASPSGSLSLASTWPGSQPFVPSSVPQTSACVVGTSLSGVTASVSVEVEVRMPSLTV